VKILSLENLMLSSISFATLLTLARSDCRNSPLVSGAYVQRIQDRLKGM
jgi:hypothetical protein